MAKALNPRAKSILKIAAEVTSDGFQTKIKIAQCTDPAIPGIPMEFWFGDGSTFDEVEHEIELRDLFRAREDIIARVSEHLYRSLAHKLPGDKLF